MHLQRLFLPLYVCAISFLVCTCRATTASSHGTLQSCPGYSVSNVQHSTSGLTAALTLAGPACNVYGQDLKNLKLDVTYETASRVHVMIYDDAEQVYQVPESVFARPTSQGVSAADSALGFSYASNPFSFAITRTSTGETLFNTSGSNLVFESQYLNLRTSLPQNPHLYGLGEHSDPFMLNTTNYTRTLWSRDAPDVPPGTNLYGNHPIYFDHRGASGTHGVFLLNSNGMDIKINNTQSTGQYLEYNAIGGIVDLYFMAGPTPIEVSQQYGEVAGYPAMLPYWSFGFHQCRYGMQDAFEVAAVIANYSTANIPLETMWTDIDYMDGRKDFTLDPQRFPLHMMQQIVDYLHSHEQNYVMMVDPAISTQSNYSTYQNGVSSDVFLKYANGTLYEGVVWPGVTVFPDWFAPNAQGWWNSEFEKFFDPDSGVNIDGLWIDMNEVSNFCIYPCTNPQQQAAGDPPTPPPVRPNAGYPIPGFPPDFQPGNGQSKRHPSADLEQTRPELASAFYKQHPAAVEMRAASQGNMSGLPGRDLISPLYTIQNAAGALSLRTLNTDLSTHNGLTTYDTHNLYGDMMSLSSRNAMLNRRPGVRPLVITRSTFAGAGNHTGHWLGDNVSDWPHYLVSMAQMLEFNAMFQLPMVGADVCGYNGNTTVPLCARWMSLGAFSPFYRNHKGAGLLPQEAYRWPLVAEASRNAIAARFRLLDYFYTAVYGQTSTGTPSLYPLFFLYPHDANTFAIQYQFFFGPHVLVSPVTSANATSVDIYLPDDIFYDFYTYAPVRGHAATLHLPDVPFTTIPLHLRGGGIIPMRCNSAQAGAANTTAQLRTRNFDVVVAPGLDGTAAGLLYLDEGTLIEQPQTSNIAFTYDSSGTFTMHGSFGYDMGSVVIERITLLGASSAAAANGPKGGAAQCNAMASYCSFNVHIPLTGPFSMSLK